MSTRIPWQHSRWPLALVALLAAGTTASGSGALLRITSQPAGAKILLDGQSQELTPQTIQRIDPGQHLVEISKDGYVPQRRTVALMDGDRTTADFKLEQLKGLVLVLSTPAGAEVDVDGAFRGKTPLLLTDLPIGEHSVALRTEGYQQRKLALTIIDRTPIKLNTDLRSDSATLKVTSEPTGAAVVLNGATRGTTPCTVDRIPSGTVDLEITLQGYEPYHSQIVLKAGDLVDVPAQLKAMPSTLKVHSIPEHARIYLNDQYQGETPMVFSNLPPGEVRVRAELRGYEADARNLTLKPADQLSEEFRLQRNSGGLVIITEPAGAKVFVDDEDAGTTQPSTSNPQISEPLRVSFIGRGEHWVKLVKPGYSHTPVKITIDTDNLITRTEHMKRLFIPDTLIRTGSTAEESYTGLKVRKYPNGDVEMEMKPGIFQTFHAADIKFMGPIQDKR